MNAAITPMTVLLAFCAVVVARYFLTPLLREWPGDMPEAANLPRLNTAEEYLGALKRAIGSRLAALSTEGAPRAGPTLEERLKLVVAVFLGCDLCSYLYAQSAVDGGADSAHVRRILDGSLRGAPPEDAPLLRAAKSFARADAGPARQRRASPAPTIPGTAADSASAPIVTARLSSSLEAARFASLCCNTVLYYQRGRLDDAERKKLYLVYELSRPIEWLVARAARRREMMRTRVEG